MSTEPKADSGEKIVIRADAEIQDLIPGFLENRQRDIQSIKAALTEKDFEAIRTLGHWMKGAGAGYGLDGVTAIGEKLEEAAMPI